MEKDDEPATNNGDLSSGDDGSVASSSSSSAPAADRSEAVAAAAQLKTQEDRKRKGKLLAEDETLPINKNDAQLLEPPVAKLMGDAIRAQSPVDTTAPKAVLSKSNKKKKERRRLGHVFWAAMGGDGQSASSAGSNDAGVSLDKIDVVDDSLRRTLRELGVSPVRVYGKRLSKSDRVMNQHRLLMSCKSWEAKHGAPFPLDDILTAGEKPLVRVQAYDRRGNGFEVELKKLTCNNAYRIIKGWGKFLTNNSLVVEQDAGPEEVGLAMVQLWAFRSLALKVGVHDQPDGPLGLVIVHYRQGESPHADAAIAEILAAGSSRVVTMPRVQAIHVHEDVLGDTVQVAMPILEGAFHAHEDAMPVLEDAVDVYMDTVPKIDDDEPDEDTLEAAKAMLMLRYSFPKKKNRPRVRR